jgi:hypothetical protein
LRRRFFRTRGMLKRKRCRFVELEAENEDEDSGDDSAEESDVDSHASFIDDGLEEESGC